MKRLFFPLLILLTAQVLFGQADSLAKPVQSYLIGKRQGGANVLRWMGANYVAWQEMAQKGVVVERRALVNGLPSGPYVPVTAQALKPLPLEQWKARFGAQDTVAGAAAQTLFGQAVPMAGSGPMDAIMALQTQQSMMHGMGMLLADWRPDLAEAMALRWTDQDIEPGLAYAYRIYTPASAYLTDTAYCIVRAEERWRAPSVSDLMAAEMDHAVQLSWTYDGNLYAPSGYFIERSDDGGRQFRRLNARPFIKIQTQESVLAEEERLVYVDSLPSNYRPFHYRITAFNAFGEIGPPSRAMVLMGRDRTPPPQPQMEAPEWKEGVGLQIAWKIDDPGDLKGFMVAHSNKADIGFTPLHTGLLSPATRVFTDPAAKARGGVNYYTVTAIDTAGNAISALPHHHYEDDVTPPAAPVGLKAVVAPDGRLVLRWTPNREPDLLGYNVFFSNAPDHEMIQLNGEPIRADSFVQDLNLETLTERIYYQVTALDESFNPSPYSALLTVKKPDILPPAAPLMTNVGATDRSVTLQWAPSPSHDAAGTQLFRRKSGEKEWSQIKAFPQAQTTYTDSLLEIGQLYEYTLRAIDDDGLLSDYATPHTGRAYPAFRDAGLQGFTAEKDREKTAVNLKWQFKSRPDARIYLYKAGSDGALYLFANIESKEKQFSDLKIPAAQSVRYAAKVVYDSGAESEMTPAVEVRFE